MEAKANDTVSKILLWADMQENTLNYMLSNAWKSENTQRNYV